MKSLRTVPLAGMLGMLGLNSPAQDAGTTPPAQPAWTATDAYPIDTCVVSGRPYAGAAMQTVEIEGRSYRLCSKSCATDLGKEPMRYSAMLDRAIVDAQLADYPLDRCPISGKPLGSMGEPAQLVLDNHLVRLCCSGCSKKAKAAKGEIVRRIHEAAYAKQKDVYPTANCLVTGDPLDPKRRIEVMHGPTLLRLGCDQCLEQLNRAPAAMLTKLNAARKAKDAVPAPKSEAQPPRRDDKSGHGDHSPTPTTPAKPGRHEGHDVPGPRRADDGGCGGSCTGQSRESKGGCCGGSKGQRH